ncbi:MAG: dihydrofolate reductase family protein [Anaerolineaceae bacterium]
MRKLIYSMMVSLDGFIEDSRHSLDWVIIDRELHQYINDQQAGIGAFLYGRRMYENMSAYWPTADADPTLPDYVLEWAHIWKPMPKIVFSRTLEKVEWNSRLVRENAAKEVKKLKAHPGKDLSVGGATLAAAFVRLGLVDEFQPFVQPVVLGGGTPFFPVLDSQINLKLLETHTFGSGVVFLRYEQADKTHMAPV